METPAYVGALQVFRFFGARVTFLPCDGEGVDPGALGGARAQAEARLPHARRSRTRAASAPRRAGAPRWRRSSPQRRAPARGRPLPRALVRRPRRRIATGRRAGAARFLPGELLQDGRARAAHRVRPRPARARPALRPRQAGADLHTNTLGQHLRRACSRSRASTTTWPGSGAPTASAVTRSTARCARACGGAILAHPTGGMFLWARLVGEETRRSCSRLHERGSAALGRGHRALTGTPPRTPARSGGSGASSRISVARRRGAAARGARRAGAWRGEPQARAVRRGHLAPREAIEDVLVEPVDLCRPPWAARRGGGARGFGAGGRSRDGRRGAPSERRRARRRRSSTSKRVPRGGPPRRRACARAPASGR